MPVVGIHSLITWSGETLNVDQKTEDQQFSENSPGLQHQIGIAGASSLMDSTATRFLGFVVRQALLDNPNHSL